MNSREKVSKHLNGYWVACLYIHGRVQWRKFVMNETWSVDSMTNFTLEESMNTSIMQPNNALKYFDTFLRAHSISSPFRAVKCRGHWTDHNGFQGSITRLDYGQFQINTWCYWSWSSRCMIKKCSWSFPMWKFAIDSTLHVLSMSNSYQWTHPWKYITLEESMNIFVMQLNHQMRVCDTFAPQFIQLTLLFASLILSSLNWQWRYPFDHDKIWWQSVPNAHVFLWNTDF